MTAVEMITREIDEEMSVSPTKTKPIVIATDGSDAALAAFRAAMFISKRTGADVRVISVLEPLPLMLPPVEGIVSPPRWDEIRERGQRDMVQAQLKTFESGSPWPVDVVFGKPCEAIASYAREHDSSLIIIGANKHGMLGRLLGEETAVDISRLSDVPLLIAAPNMSRLPKRIIVGMDLDPDGMQMTAKTLAMVTDTPSVSCVHVQPRDEFLGVDWAQYDKEYQFATSERFAVVEKSLSSSGLRPDFIQLHGDPAKEIVDFSAYSKAELIVVGIKRKFGKSRAIGGRTARRIIRNAGCSVMIVPNIIAQPGLKLHAGTDVINDSKLWDTSLRGFTARNAGRIVSLEVDDPEMGAVVEAKNYPLIGVDYDHRDECLTIILGDVHGVERHLTRTIVKPGAVSILSGDGRDAALSVTHNGGQTLLTF